MAQQCDLPRSTDYWMAENNDEWLRCQSNGFLSAASTETFIAEGNLDGHEDCWLNSFDIDGVTAVGVESDCLPSSDQSDDSIAYSDSTCLTEDLQTQSHQWLQLSSGNLVHEHHNFVDHDHGSDSRIACPRLASLQLHDDCISAERQKTSLSQTHETSHSRKSKPVKTAPLKLKKFTKKQRKHTVKNAAVSRSQHREESLNSGAGKLFQEARAEHVSLRDPKRKAKHLNCKGSVSCQETKANLKRPPSQPANPNTNDINLGEGSGLSIRSASKVDVQLINIVGVSACPFCPTHDESANPEQSDETESMSLAMGAKDGVRARTMKSKRRRRTQKLGRWWRKYGYNGPPYCQRCADTFSNHVMRKLTSTSVCSPSKLCQCCDKIASYLPAGQISRIN